MAAGRHGSARTTPRVRAELQAAQTSSRALAIQFGLNPKTVLKWRKRDGTAGAVMGPKPRSSTLTEAEEAIVVEFRKRTLLPLDDVLGCLRESIPKLTRSALHRCLVRHGISRLPRDEEKASKRGRFAEAKIGYVHIDACELRLTEGKLFMFLAIDRVSKAKPLGLRRVHPRRLLRRQHQAERRRFPARCRRGLPLPHPHRADRQRRPVHAQCLHPLGPLVTHLRPCLRRARHRAPPDQTLPSLDQRPGRTHEPHRQGRHHQGVPLPGPRSAEGPRSGLRVSLQLRQAPQSPAVANTVPDHLRRLESRPIRVQDQPAPPHPGTKQTQAPRPLQPASRSHRSGFMLGSVSAVLPQHGRSSARAGRPS